MCQHFRWLQVIENVRERKIIFVVLEVKKTKDYFLYSLLERAIYPDYRKYSTVRVRCFVPGHH